MNGKEEQTNERTKRKKNEHLICWIVCDLSAPQSHTLQKQPEPDSSEHRRIKALNNACSPHTYMYYIHTHTHQPSRMFVSHWRIYSSALSRRSSSLYSIRLYVHLRYCAIVYLVSRCHRHYYLIFHLTCDRRRPPHNAATFYSPPPLFFMACSLCIQTHRMVRSLSPSLKTVKKISMK